MLAVVALVVAGSVAVNGVLPKGTPFVIFSSGVAGFLTNLGLSKNIASAYVTMCVSALALTTLDSVAHIGRMAFQEFFLDTDEKVVSPIKKFITNKYFATVITLVEDGLQLIVAVLLRALGLMVAFHSFGKLFGKDSVEELESQAV